MPRWTRRAAVAVSNATLDGAGFGRQAAAGGFRVVRDCCLNFLPLPNAMGLHTPTDLRAQVGL
jgi:hypothetical protein